MKLNESIGHESPEHKLFMRYTGTVKFLNFRMPENIAVIYLKFKQRRQTLWEFHQKGANGIANNENPDQTAPLGAVLSGSALIAQT